MTYTDRYNAIIHYFQRHPVDKTKIYCERHHILPKSCGGSNNKENLVNLPAAWHYRVHCYLPFVMLEQNDINGYKKMIYAWKRCLNSNKEKIDLMCINKECLEYKLLRESVAKIQSEISKKYRKENPINGDKNPMTNCKWWKDPNDKTKSMVIKKGDPVPKGWIRGHWNCNHLKINRIEYCPYCGAEKNNCKHPEICSKYQMIIGYKKIFHPNENIYGSEKFYSIWFSDLALIKQWYINEKLSIVDIANKLNYKRKSLSSLYSCVGRMLNLQNIKLRSFSDATKISSKKRTEIK